MRVTVLALGALLLAGPVLADDPPPCPDKTQPVVSLGFGSRYAEDSKSRSDFDEESDKAVTAALKPIDSLIADLARQTDLLNDSETDPKVAADAARCVLDSVRAWAAVDALSDLTSQGANLSVPSRVGGIAFAYAAIRAYGTAPDPVIEDWLRARAGQAMDFFDNDAPPRASQNNLRAWAGLAVTRIGLVLDDPALIDWGASSAELVLCTADPDGSLPNEMWRDRLALHYQLHAVGPLVVTVALLQERRPELVTACDGALSRVVAFTLAALKDPAIVQKITGKTQTVGGPKRKPRDFEMAWVPAYLRLNPEPAVAALVKDIEKLGNSKLGGDQRLIWPEPATPEPTDG